MNIQEIVRAKQLLETVIACHSDERLEHDKTDHYDCKSDVEEAINKLKIAIK